jgi:hypothetical protein
MPIRIPIINGQKPDVQYNLDNEDDLKKLKIDPKDEGKISDRYVHYQNCKHAVIESKGSTAHKAIEQIESTVKRLLSAGNKVDFAILIMKRLSRTEQRSFKRRKDRVLIDPQTREPYTVRVGSEKRTIFLLYTSEADITCDGMDKYLSPKSIATRGA